MTYPALDVTDTGLGRAGAHIELDRAWLCVGAESPPKLRFYRVLPSVVIGRHQRFEHEARADYCRRHGIDLLRRVTGGGAVYIDPQQLAWSLVAPLPEPCGHMGMAALLQALCEAVADELRRQELPVSFRPPNDMEIAGRKIASAYLARTERALLFHGTLLLDIDIERALCALRVPTEKLSQSGLEGARQRLATVRELTGHLPEPGALQNAIANGIGRYLGLSPQWEQALPIPLASQDATDGTDVELDPARTAEAFWKASGGRLRAKLQLDAVGERIERAFVGGDLMVYPLDLLDQLSGELVGSPVAEVVQRVTGFFQGRSFQMPGILPQDIRGLLQRALERVEQQHLFGLDLDQANRLMVLDPDQGRSAPVILERASVMLVPYCAKLARCKWRNLDGCPECGGCEVGDAYRLARERGMRVVSIRNYEHLCGTLQELKQQGVQGYVGMCCQHFFIKRHQAFLDAGIPTVLMDVSGSNCYELRQEEQAYAGTFQAQARLDIHLLCSIMECNKPTGQG